MDFYSGKQPNLIGPVMKSTVCKVMKQKPVNNTVSDKVILCVTTFYKDYVVENLFIIILLLCVVIFLIHRYNMSKNGKEGYKNNKETFDKNLFNEVTDYQTRHLIYDDPPHMNPIMTPDNQKYKVNYVPDDHLINVPGVGLIDPKLLNPPKPDVPFNNVNYDYNNVYTDPSRSYYNGTYDTYKNAQDTDAVNPYDWSNNFNTNTGAFVSPMTDLNNQNLVDYQNLLDEKKNNLLHAINPQY